MIAVLTDNELLHEIAGLLILVAVLLGVIIVVLIQSRRDR